MFSNNNIAEEVILKELQFQRDFYTNMDYRSPTNGMNLLHIAIADYRNAEILECVLSDYKFDPNEPVEINQQIKHSRRYKKEYDNERGEDYDEDEEDPVFKKTIVKFLFLFFDF